MLGLSSPIGRLRQPASTGSNRCWPCTVLNAAIGVVASGLVAAALVTVGYPLAAAASAIGVVGLSGAVIWLRGYLVPGTPTLTKRYFPTWLLSWFGKERSSDAMSSTEPGDATFDPERLFVEMGALEPCRGDDLCLTDEFGTTWWSRIESERDTGDEANHELLVAELGLDEDDVEFGGDSATLSHPDRGVITLWVSRAALLADVAAAATVADRFDGWSSLSPHERMGLVHGLRAFLQACPDCDGDLSFDSEPIPSCCVDQQVVTLNCDRCESRIIENTVETDGLGA